jgi:hypothetical protein
LPVNEGKGHIGLGKTRILEDDFLEAFLLEVVRPPRVSNNA